MTFIGQVTLYMCYIHVDLYNKLNIIMSSMTKLWYDVGTCGLYIIIGWDLLRLTTEQWRAETWFYDLLL